MSQLGLQCMIVVFPDHTNLLYDTTDFKINNRKYGFVVQCIAWVKVFRISPGFRIFETEADSPLQK